ncbi:mupirocin-resistant isoleucine--tRNA ligase MupA [Staphylococcus aureus]|uniref:mupirocin-resistant isoleucine--tRNA ligase MupA n=1 Tax=Staphylococcus aureus TaxID=1280 RepID=UPI000DA4404C|nr:mupirocin-resistant isoleucine--tRNA ligase MupA [Staphylococcus aureus]SRF58174.1 isoleucyl-tRNA synthetase [Staphylococcus aureus]
MTHKKLNTQHEISEFWNANHIFKKSMENRRDNEKFVFYDGPPTANGLPHAGHVLGRVIKDLVSRFKTMQGFYVERKAGWDTHGLPVELEVEKKIGIEGKKDIENYGIENFINECKNSVFNYAKEWRDFSNALGYWVDMDNPYITLDNNYIESVWNILSTFHKQGLLYKGHKVTPYCTHDQTALSSHEVAQGYKNVKDLSAIVKFQQKNDINTFFLSWTTTPWTLPANVALAINKNMNYSKIQIENSYYILATDLIDSIITEEYTFIETFSGKDLINLEYVPPFKNDNLTNAYYVVDAEFVTNSEGTGIVHIAPAHGEDDYKLASENNLEFLNVITIEGIYNYNFLELEGKKAKDSDIEIIKLLSKKKLLYKKQKYEHSYPHCWRCGNPLIYYAMEGWFIKTTNFKEEIIKNNKNIDWFPSHIKDGRMGNFLENMVDWNIGRNRYWGTPLNVWTCNDCNYEFSPNSIEDLRTNSLNEVPKDIELHRPYVDDIICHCPKCNGKMTREEEVIDVWFDSGSMPFAQHHYPFDDKKDFKQHFPADFIAEGVDQTRGWFYSLLVISTILKGQSSYKRAFSLGHILDSNGKKMSKSKGNVINPSDLINKYGADSLRWALISDSAPWNNKRFSESIVAQTKSKFIETLDNIYKFYNMYNEIDKFKPQSQYSENLLDKWALSRLNTLIKETNTHINNYDFTSASRLINDFTSLISNWYIRRSRSRFWEEGLSDDKINAYNTLYEILINLSKLIAPFTPFISEKIHYNLTGESVHLTNYPQHNDSLINRNLEDEMYTVIKIVELARQARKNANLKVKQPLSELIIKSNKQLNLNFLSNYNSIIKDELNIKNVKIVSNINDYISYDINLNFSSAGPKLGNKVKEVKTSLNSLSEKDKKNLVESKDFQKLSSDILLTDEDFVIKVLPIENYQLSDDSDYSVLLNKKLSSELIHEGNARELIRLIQQLRKKKDLPINQRIDLHIGVKGDLLDSINSNKGMFKENLLINNFSLNTLDEYEDIISLNNKEIKISLLY